MKLSIALLLAATALHAEVTVVVDRNMGDNATPAFRFAHVPPPSRDDAATNAKIEMIAGRVDANSPGLAAINDGRAPADWDEPASNLFFAPGTWGGRFRIDLGAVTAISQINSYSWHPDSRAAQLYKVYGSDGSEGGLQLAPGSKIDPAAAGWKLIAFVDTRPAEGETGGQYGVSIRDVGRYRYLLFDVFETEGDDDWSNTFYSEIDVIAGRLTP